MQETPDFGGEDKLLRGIIKNNRLNFNALLDKTYNKKQQILK
jgi:hypothetical protein